MRFFVTGVTGFLGRAFCDAASQRGHEVLGLCRSAGTSVRCQVARGCMADIPWGAIERFRPEMALHLAWIATPGVYLTSPENALLVDQSEFLFRGLTARGVGHIAGTGTCIEYAPSDLPLREDESLLAPEFPYSRAKVEVLNRLQKLGQETKTGWSWLRVFYPYGEGEHSGRLPTTLMKKLASGETLELKTPDSRKDYIHIADVATAILTTLENRINGAVNIGTGEGVRIMDLAQSIARSCEADLSHVKRSATPAPDAFPVTIANPDKLRAAGWRPRISLEEGLRRLRHSLHLG